MNLIQATPQKRRWISLTPLIDVVFILLMFFMLTTQFYRNGVMNVAVASGVDTGNAAGNKDIVRIRVYASGQWEVGNQRFTVTDKANLKRLVGDSAVTVEADSSASLQDVVFVLDTLADINIPNALWIPADTGNTK